MPTNYGDNSEYPDTTVTSSKHNLYSDFSPEWGGDTGTPAHLDPLENNMLGLQPQEYVRGSGGPHSALTQSTSRSVREKVRLVQF